MKNLRAIILSAMVAGILVVPAVSATADTKDAKGYSHFRKTDHHDKWNGHHGAVVLMTELDANLSLND